MTDICNTAIMQYFNQLHSDFFVYPSEDRCVIVTPYLYPDFASIEYSIQSIGNSYLLADDGETLNMLFINGLSIEGNNKLWKSAQQIAKTHGVELDKTGISIISEENNLGEASQKLLNAIQAIGYFLYKRRNQTRETFDDEVEKILLEHVIKYEYNFSIRGKANTHNIRFHVNSNKNALIEPVTAVTLQSARTKAKQVAYKWLDIRQVNNTFQFISIIDDRNQKWEKLWSDDEARSAIYTHSDIVVKWTSEQEKLLDILKK